MKIQFIAKNKPTIKTTHELSYATLGSPRTFDEFDINIISLQDTKIWEHTGSGTSLINDVNDFKSIKVSIQNSSQSNIIILLPQNYDFNYGGGTIGTYYYSKKLKDMLGDVKQILSYILPSGVSFDLVHEISSTKCCSECFDADFCISRSHYNTLTENLGGKHPTTIRVNARLICTTLFLHTSEKSIDNFISAIGLDNTKSDIPEWIKDFDIYDDETQKAIVRDANEEINKLKEKIEEAENKLEKNLFYKSVLYENGDNLVKPVAEMLEQFTGVSFAGFVDEKKEDFKITLENVTFIGEIKGITSNVKNEHVSQLDVHCQSYIDTLQESGTTENVKGLLIINPFRNKPLTEREEVHENQIKIAQRNGSLIITTEVFLLLFSGYLEHPETREKIIELFKTKTGILKLSDYIKEDNK